MVEVTTTDPPLEAPKPTTTQGSGGSSLPETPAATSAQDSTPKTHERAKQYQSIEGGSPNLEIWLDPTAQKLAAERLINRLQTVNAISGKELPLTDIDRVVQRLGPETIVRLEKGDLTKKDLAITVFVLRDELLQKSLAASKLVKDVKTTETTRLGKIPFLRRIVENPSLQTQLKASKQLSTGYTREIGFDQWTQDRIENDLVSLNQLRTSIELSFYGRHLDDPLFDQDSISLYTAGRKTGNRLHDAVVDELMGTEGILTQRFGGKTFLELSQEDPIAATQALYEANQRALTQFAGETAKKLLESESLKTEEGLIEKQAQRAEAKPTQEDLTKLQEAAAKTSTEFTDAETTLNELNAPVEAAERILQEKTSAFDTASRAYQTWNTHLEPKIKRLEERLQELYGSASKEPDSSLPAQQRASIEQARTGYLQQIARIEELLNGYQNKLVQLLETKAEAETQKLAQEQNIRSLKTERDQKGYADAKTDFDAKKAAKEKAKKELKEKQISTSGEASPEAKEKAKALRKWNEVVGGYDKIVDARFSQKFTDDYTREKLADIKERPDGQIEGAERIREHIFRLVLENKADYDPILARKMLSDETIARAIIWTYKLDPEVISAKGNTLSQLLSDLNETKDMIKETPEDKDLLREKTDQEKEIIKLVLPYLRSSQFQAGDLLRFMIHEGLKSAERGNPYLTLDEYYAKPKPELRLEAEGIYREGIGKTTMENNRMLWEGRVANAMNPLTFSTTVPKQHYSVGLGIDRNVVNYNLNAKTDRDFLELLPDTLDPSLPDEAKIFYDESGKLSTDKPGLAEWIKLYDGTGITTEDTLNSLDGMISTEFSKLMTSAVSDYFLKRPQPERLQMLRGFRTVENINDVALAENPDEFRNYKIRLDNTGNFFIRDVTDPASPKEEQELSSFFQKRLKDFKGSKLTLSQDERKNLQQEFLKILSRLGGEILRARQRR